MQGTSPTPKSRRQITITSAAQQTADALREHILESDPGEEWFLGSEDDVMTQLGVSRPTLRQAAKLLQQEGLLSVRRGVKGGFFATRPTHNAVTHMASVVLRTEGATYADLVGTLSALSAAATRSAAEADPDERARIADWYPSQLPDGLDGVHGRDFQPVPAGFHQLLAELSGNPTLQLFIDVLLELSLPLGNDAFNDPEIVARTAANHQRVASLIVDGHGEAAAAMLETHLIEATDWVDRNQLLAGERAGIVGRTD